MIYKLSEILTSYVEKNIEQKYQPVAVGKYGIRKREEIYKKDLAKDYSKNKVIRKDTLTIGMGSTQIDIGVLVENEVYSVSPAYHTYKINTSIVDSEFLEWILKEMNPELSKLYMISSARQGKNVDFERMMNHKINIPTLDKQLIIIKKLKHIDNLISNMKTNYSKYDEIVKSQFIEMFGDVFYNDNGYKSVKIGDVVKYEQPTKYIVSSEDYNESFEIPVLTAGKSFILGYTNENDGIFYGSKEKVVIFDDFTCDSKIVDFDFKVKSSAMKLLHMTKDINVDFFYHALKQNHYNVANHKRHWISVFEIMEMGLPSIEEQNDFSKFVQQIDKSKYFGGVCYGIC